jgi:nucleoside-diphosphate-sugar epimerase
MKILFIGGTGVISSASLQLAAERGLEISIFVRGKSSAKRPVPDSITVYQGNANQPGELDALLDEHSFDVVVNWIAYRGDQVRRDIQLLRGRVRQYVFISSASAYQKPVRRLPITENPPLENPFWEYSRNKIDCERILIEAYQQDQFPVTIIRPSHTYDKTLLPFQGAYTVVERLIQGKPVVVHGDGTSLWTLTHHADFARGFVPLLGHPEAVGEAFQITSDQILTWNQIFEITAKAFGGSFNPVFIPSTVIARFDPDWGAGLLGDKMYSVIFDNTKIRTLVPDFQAEIPFQAGVQEIADWYQQPANQQTDPEFDALLDKLTGGPYG